MNRLTRRQLAVAVVGAAPVLSPATSTAQTSGSPDKLAEARQSVRETAAKLKEFDLPLAAAPAFIFKP